MDLLARETLPFKNSNPREMSRDMGLDSRPPKRSRLEETSLAD
jgi:hypothetical protein